MRLCAIREDAAEAAFYVALTMPAPLDANAEPASRCAELRLTRRYRQRDGVIRVRVTRDDAATSFARTLSRRDATERAAAFV